MFWQHQLDSCFYEIVSLGICAIISHISPINSINSGHVCLNIWRFKLDNLSPFFIFSNWSGHSGDTVFLDKPIITWMTTWHPLSPIIFPCLGHHGQVWSYFLYKIKRTHTHIYICIAYRYLFIYVNIYMAGIFFIPNIPQHIQVHPKISSGSKTGSVLINPTAAGWAPWTRDWHGKTMHLATSFFSAFFLEPFPNYQKIS